LVGRPAKPFKKWEEGEIRKFGKNPRENKGVAKSLKKNPDVASFFPEGNGKRGQGGKNPLGSARERRSGFRTE